MTLQQNAVTEPNNFKEKLTGLEKKSIGSFSEVVEILLKEGIITPKQVQHAQRVMSKLETNQPLVSVLRELRFVTDEQVHKALQKNPISMPLADLLVELDYIHDSDLKIAREIQAKQKTKQDLDKILVDHRLIEEHSLLNVSALKLGISYIEPELSQIDRKLFSKAQLKWFEKHQLIPLGREEQGVRIAFVDPCNKKNLEAAKQLFGNNILPAITRRETVAKVIKWVKQHDQRKGIISSDENVIVKLVNSIILAAIEQDVSDIHIEPLKEKLRVRFRHDGVLNHFEDFSTSVAPALTSRLKVMCDLDITEKRRHQGGRILFEYPDGEIDLRVSFYITVHGEKIVLRLLNRKGLHVNLKHVGMAPRMLKYFKEEALYQPSGVILVTGPTGSGKTTTVYSCIHHINDPQTAIITAEEPVEFVVDGISQCSINPKINLTYEETLRHIVRQDPDVIVIGEIRDNFSADVAVQAALTGHKVLTTFHTEDSVGGLIRLLKMNIEAFLISSTVVGILAQRLARKVCPECGQTCQPSTAELHRMGYTTEDIVGMTFRKGRGCSNCQYTGYKGRVGIFELLVLNDAVRSAVIEQKTSQELRRICIESAGLVTLMEDGIYKAAAGVTTIEEVFRCLPRLQKPRPLLELRRYLGDLS